jgi:hypothetical protein
LALPLNLLCILISAVSLADLRASHRAFQLSGRREVSILELRHFVKDGLLYILKIESEFYVINKDPKADSSPKLGPIKITFFINSV